MYTRSFNIQLDLRGISAENDTHDYAKTNETNALHIAFLSTEIPAFERSFLLRIRISESLHRLCFFSGWPPTVIRLPDEISNVHGINNFLHFSLRFHDMIFFFFA